MAVILRPTRSIVLYVWCIGLWVIVQRGEKTLGAEDPHTSVEETDEGEVESYQLTSKLT